MKKSYLNNLILEAYAEVVSELNEAPDGLYYIKVPRIDKAMLNAVQNTIETIYHPTKFTDIVDDDGAGNVIMYFPKEDFDPGMIDDLEGEGVDISSQTNLPIGLNESLLDEIEEEDPKPEEEPDMKAGPETVLEDATDKILSKFPTLRQAIIKLQSEDFKEFVDTIDWISPRPTSFRVNLKNGQDYILKWTGKSFEASILGKRYLLSNIADYQQALDKLAILYREAPMKGAGEEEEEGGGADADFGSASGGGGGDFPGADAGGDTGGDDIAADDAGGEEGGEDLSDEPVDFETGEEG